MMILFCFDILTLQIKIYYQQKMFTNIFKYKILNVTKRVKRTPAPVI
jgi:hypothetical protein